MTRALVLIWACGLMTGILYADLRRPVPAAGPVPAPTCAPYSAPARLPDTRGVRV